MKVAVVGLGLIGGSVCKALKENTSHVIYGINRSKGVLTKALDAGAIDHAIVDNSDLKEIDIVYICLYPETVIDFIKENVSNFKKGSIICDACGVKSPVVYKAEKLLHGEGVFFVGTHPMAGREFSGFDYSTPKIFEGASFIITKTPETHDFAAERIKELAEAMKFGEIIFTSPEDHDRNIAFTSQLAHIVSNAYIKSPSLRSEHGFSAGSFQDLTRVAKLNEEMWTSLFLLNDKNLINELSILIDHLDEYRQALINGDADRLRELLKAGRLLKEGSLE